MENEGLRPPAEFPFRVFEYLLDYDIISNYEKLEDLSEYFILNLFIWKYDGIPREMLDLQLSSHFYCSPFIHCTNEPCGYFEEETADVKKGYLPNAAKLNVHFLCEKCGKFYHCSIKCDSMNLVSNHSHNSSLLGKS